MRIIFSIILVLWMTISFSEPQEQSLSALREVADAFLEDHIKVLPSERRTIELGKLDPRLRLPYCPKDNLKAFFISGENNISVRTVGLSCNGESLWTVYLPVRVHIYTNVLVSKRVIGKGELLDSDNMTLVERDRSLLNTNYYTDPSRLKGMVSKSTISASQIITSTMIQAQLIIQRGDAVTIVARGSGLKVEMQGIAMSDGGVGQSVLVQNTSSKHLVEGVVIDKTHVGVKL
jgi:flagellar basal body P-ring formation protein FlgA